MDSSSVASSARELLDAERLRMLDILRKKLLLPLLVLPTALLPGLGLGGTIVVDLDGDCCCCCTGRGRDRDRGRGGGGSGRSCCCGEDCVPWLGAGDGARSEDKSPHALGLFFVGEWEKGGLVHGVNVFGS